MAHEITSTDRVVLHRQAAWHGLGTIVQDAPTVAEALKLARLDWTVESWPLSATNGEGLRVILDDHVANVRSDTRAVLGVVGKGYHPIQNRELADFCEALAEQGDTVKIETAGSIRGGAKVWFLLKGQSFSVRGGDDVTPYILAANGHDGGTALSLTPTSIRVVCSNTLHMVIPENNANRESERRLRFRQNTRFVSLHTRGLKDRLEEAKTALQLYGRTLDATRNVIDTLTAREMDETAIRRFWIERVAADFGPIPVKPETAEDRRRAEKAEQALAAIDARFIREATAAGRSDAWLAFNAYTGWLQHDRPIRVKDAALRQERRVSSNLMGENAERTLKAMESIANVAL